MCSLIGWHGEGLTLIGCVWHAGFLPGPPGVLSIPSRSPAAPEPGCQGDGFESLLLMIEILFGFPGALAGEEQFSHRSWQSLPGTHGGWKGSAGITSLWVGWVGQDTLLVREEHWDPLGTRVLLQEGGGCRCPNSLCRCLKSSCLWQLVVKTKGWHS